MNGIILTSDIHIVSSCESYDSLINASYLNTTSIDINRSGKVTLIAFSEHESFVEKCCTELLQIFCWPLPFVKEELYFL